MHHLVLAVHLGAGEARRHRMVGVALELEQAPVLHGGDARALIGAIVGAGGADGLDHRWLQGGVGKRLLPVATSSGHTTTWRPSCHWMVTMRCPI
jgi:hypothetical protein